MKFALNLIAMAAIAAGVSSCAQPQKATPARTGTSGSRFDDVGRVALHVGQPCTPQIMFDFRGARSTSPVWLAAPMRETKVLTDAANRDRRAHVSGTWQHSRVKGCSYVNVTKVEPQKSIW